MDFADECKQIVFDIVFAYALPVWVKKFYDGKINSVC